MYKSKVGGYMNSSTIRRTRPPKGGLADTIASEAAGGGQASAIFAKTRTYFVLTKTKIAKTRTYFRHIFKNLHENPYLFQQKR